MTHFDDVTAKLGELPYMDEARAKVIRELILECSGRNLLEIGFYHGKSSAYLAAILEDRGGPGSLTTIDLARIRSLKPSIGENLATVGLTHRVTPLFTRRSYTWEMARMLKREPRPQFDFCYFDGGHTWDLTGFGLLLVDMLLRPGGIIVIDDLNWTINRSIAKNPSAAKAYASYDDDEKSESGVRLAWNTIIPHLGYTQETARLFPWGIARKPSVQRPRAEAIAKKSQRAGLARGFSDGYGPMDNAGISLNSYDPESAPAEVLDYPGMMSRREKGLLFWLAKNVYKGDGLIVDAGLFLGASTNAFATGIKSGAGAEAVSQRFKPINSYDVAVWVRSMDRYLKIRAVQRALRGKEIRTGQSFLPILKRLLASHHDLIDFRIGDIVKTASADRPIEIAFYDCLKTPEREAAAFRAFAPRFIPGKTIVVQQDYFYESATALKIRQEFLAPYFSYLGSEATSAVFRLEKSLPETYFREDPVTRLSVDEKVALLVRAAERTRDPKFRLYGQLAVVEFLTEVGDQDHARTQLADVLRDAPERPEEVFGARMAATLERFKERLAT